MYTVLVNLNSDEAAEDLARQLSDSMNPIGSRPDLFVWRPSDSPSVVDAYTFDKGVAEKAHALLAGLAREYAKKHAA